MPSDAEVVARLLAEDGGMPAAVGGGDDASVIQGILAESHAAPVVESQGLGDSYRSYVAGPSHDIITRLLSTVGVPKGARDFIAGAVVPDSLAGAGIALGSMVVPGAGPIAGTAARNAPKIMPMLERLAGPMMGGALGGFLDKGDPTEAAIGGVVGLGGGAFGEGVSAGLGRLAKSRLVGHFRKNDPIALDNAVRGVLSEFPNMKTPEQFQEAVFGGLAQEKISEMYGSELGRLSKAVSSVARGGSPKPASQVLASELTLFDQGGNIHSPVIRELKAAGVLDKGPTTFDDLAEAVQDLRLKGRTSKGDPKLTLDGKQARAYAEQLSGEISSALATLDPRLAMRYQQMDLRYSQGAEMIRLLKQPGVLDKDGNVNMRVLQEAFRGDRAAGINRRFTPAQVKELRDAIFRGAPATAIDVMKRAASGGPGESFQAGPLRIWGKLTDMLQGPDFAGDYNVPLPYLSPKAAALGAERTAGGIGYAVDRPITLTAPPEEE